MRMWVGNKEGVYSTLLSFSVHDAVSFVESVLRRVILNRKCILECDQDVHMVPIEEPVSGAFIIHQRA